jgi:hypothetical protein
MLRMNWKETALVTLNAALLAIFYTLLGVLVSFVLYYLFDEFNDEWESQTLLYRLTDVSLEISLLYMIAFWSAHVIEIAPPIFAVRKELDILVDSYISGIFYVFAVFVFMNDLTDKLKSLFEVHLGEVFKDLFPKHGSIVDLSLSYTPKKTDKQKSQE